MGVSQIRFNREGKVAFHQDFWDSGKNFYAHLPVIGGAVGLCRQALEIQLIEIARWKSTSPKEMSPWGTFVLTICQWLDSDFRREGLPDPSELPEKVNWQRTLPFIFLHLGCLAVFWVGFSPVAVGAAVFLYLIRMFAITGFYHRYFSHKTFKTSRFVQFLFAVIGNSSMQRGPLWWAATHRHHHKHSDHEGDIHSPVISGFRLVAHRLADLDEKFSDRLQEHPRSEQVSGAGFPQPLRPDGAVRLRASDAGDRLGVGDVSSRRSA